MMCCIPNKVCDVMIRELSNECGCKIDYQNTTGRNILRCKENDYDVVNKYLSGLAKDYFNEYGVGVNGYVLY